MVYRKVYFLSGLVTTFCRILLCLGFVAYITSLSPSFSQTVKIISSLHIQTEPVRIEEVLQSLLNGLHLGGLPRLPHALAYRFPASCFILSFIPIVGNSLK